MQSRSVVHDPDGDVGQRRQFEQMLKLSRHHLSAADRPSEDGFVERYFQDKRTRPS
jgi:hypothetical protein